MKGRYNSAIRRFPAALGQLSYTLYLPAAGVQQDASRGFVRDAWMKFEKAGTYDGQCAKICGEGGFMPIVVEVPQLSRAGSPHAGGRI